MLLYKSVLFVLIFIFLADIGFPLGVPVLSQCLANSQAFSMKYRQLSDNRVLIAWDISQAKYRIPKFNVESPGFQETVVNFLLQEHVLASADLARKHVKKIFITYVNSGSVKDIFRVQFETGTSTVIGRLAVSIKKEDGKLILAYKKNPRLIKFYDIQEKTNLRQFAKQNMAMSKDGDVEDHFLFGPFVEGNMPEEHSREYKWFQGDLLSLGVDLSNVSEFSYFIADMHKGNIIQSKDGLFLIDATIYAPQDNIEDIKTTTEILGNDGGITCLSGGFLSGILYKYFPNGKIPPKSLQYFKVSMHAIIDSIQNHMNTEKDKTSMPQSTYRSDKLSNESSFRPFSDKSSVGEFTLVQDDANSGAQSTFSASMLNSYLEQEQEKYENENNYENSVDFSGVDDYNPLDAFIQECQTMLDIISHATDIDRAWKNAKLHKHTELMRILFPYFLQDTLQKEDTLDVQKFIQRHVIQSVPEKDAQQFILSGALSFFSYYQNVKVFSVIENMLTVVQKVLNKTRKIAANSALLEAARKGDIVTLKKEFHYADINTQDEEKNTALIIAAENNYPECVTLLLSHPDIKIDIRNNADEDALAVAEDFENDTIVEILLSHMFMKEALLWPIFQEANTAQKPRDIFRLEGQKRWKQVLKTTYATEKEKRKKTAFLQIIVEDKLQWAIDNYEATLLPELFQEINTNDMYADLRAYLPADDSNSSLLEFHKFLAIIVKHIVSGIENDRIAETLEEKAILLKDGKLPKAKHIRIEDGLRLVQLVALSA